MALASAWEWMATVWMPSSLQARRMRSAISPRLAMRTLENIALALFDDDEGFAVFDRRGVIDQNAGDGARFVRRDLVHGLHGFDDQNRLALGDPGADLDEG